METMDSHYKGLPEGARVLQEISSMDELQIGKIYFNPTNGKLFWFLGKAISPDDFEVHLMFNTIDPVSGKKVEDDKQAFCLPLVNVELPDGFLKM